MKNQFLLWFACVAMGIISCAEPQQQDKSQANAQTVSQTGDEKTSPENKDAACTSSDDYSCVDEEEEALATAHFGKKISPNMAMSLGSLFDAMKGEDAMPAKVEGKVKEVCQVKGCWMTLEKEDGSTMRVTFKDYGFFVPKDLPGEKVVVEGQARRDTVPVKVLRHYAEDAGKSPEEIASIKEPEITVGFVADGVLVREDT